MNKTFGVVFSYFRILFTSIQTTVDKIDIIVVAACILHNMMRSEKIYSPSESSFGNIINIKIPTASFLPLATRAGHPNAIAAEIRDTFKHYFNGLGAVEWQDRMTN